MTEKNGMVNSVDHALRLIACLAEAERPQGVSDLARALDLPRPTIYRLLGTLLEHQVVVRDDKSYRLGLRLLELGGKALSAVSLQAVCLPFLTELVERTGETAHFAVLDGEQAGYVAKVDSAHPIRMSSHVGWRGPLHATAVGKVLLAWSPPELLARITSGALTRYTEQTIVDADVLAAEIAKVRRQGFAIDSEELLDGLVCIAAPVRSGARLVGAASVSGPALRVRQQVKPMAAIVCETAARMGAAF
jgi:IclR family acetate operon transcriptional repressor